MRARPLVAATVAAALVSCTLWIAGQSPSQVPGALTVASSPAPAADLLAEVADDVRRGRCATCGVVVGISESQASGFEFTMRLRDGSMRVSTSASRGSWHIGDAVMLMGGAAAPRN